MPNTCECGCGEVARKRFITHHNLRAQENCAFRPDVALKKSISQKAAIARKSPQERAQWANKMRTTIRERLMNEPEHRRRVADRMRIRRKLPSFLDAYHRADKIRAAAIKKTWDDLSPEERALRIRATALGCGVHPNKQELRLDAVLWEQFPGEFDINVASCRVIAGKLPDFIHRSLPLLVDMFGTYWHSPEKTGRDRHTEEYTRHEHFSLHGYELVVIWEEEL